MRSQLQDIITTSSVSTKNTQSLTAQASDLSTHNIICIYVPCMLAISSIVVYVIGAKRSSSRHLYMQRFCESKNKFMQQCAGHCACLKAWRGIMIVRDLQWHVVGWTIGGLVWPG